MWFAPLGVSSSGPTMFLVWGGRVGGPEPCPPPCSFAAFLVRHPWASACVAVRGPSRGRTGGFTRVGGGVVSSGRPLTAGPRPLGGGGVSVGGGGGWLGRRGVGGGVLVVPASQAHVLASPPWFALGLPLRCLTGACVPSGGGGGEGGVWLGWAGGLMQEQALGCGLPSLPHHETEVLGCAVPRPSGLSTATRPLRSVGGRIISSSCV